MTQYSVPLDDYRFVFDVLDLGSLALLPGLEEATPELAEQIIAEAGRFAGEALFPLNRDSDEVGARFADGRVSTPPGFQAAYRAFCDNGWPALNGPKAYGGQGMPHYLGYCLTEITSATCISFTQYTALTHGAAMAVEAHASDALKALYLPKLISGEWTGTMCLTEAQAGTDLGLLRTRARPNGDGAYIINGTKIFISAGEHDLSENIVHLVLARLPDAPAGVKGISLFIVPKFLPDGDGAPGSRNSLACGSIEHKMGMKGAVACVMNFDDATGWLVGEPHQGLKAMFTMMNTERLILSAQGQGVAETAYQSALAYACDRLQGRSPSGPKAPEKPADPIIVHPDVRRMLLTMKAHAEGGRALALWVMRQLDVAAHHPEPAERAKADAFVALMTPVVKVWLSDTGFEVANLGVQVFGGHGYIREWGMEQLVRDIRILQLYEGANGIQALDLVGRKLPMENGGMLRHLTDPVEAYVAQREGEADIDEFIAPLRIGLERLDRATNLMLDRAATNADELGAASMDYLKIAGYLAASFVWAQMAAAALRQCETNPEFFTSKLTTARFFFSKMLPAADAHFAALEAGSSVMMSWKP